MSKCRFAISAVMVGAVMALGATNAWADDLVASRAGTERLYFFDSTRPQHVRDQEVHGMQEDEAIVGLAVRPRTGGLYVVGDSSRLYLVNSETGDAVLVGGGDLRRQLFGQNFGVAFNPVTDRLRIVSDTEQNLSVDPDTGAVVEDRNLDYGDRSADPDVVAAAYSPQGSLFVVDAHEDALFLQEPPFAGILSNQETLEIDVPQRAGLDVGHDGSGFLITSRDRSQNSRLYQLDLATGDTKSRHIIDARDLNSVATLNVAVGGATPTVATAPPGAGATPPATGAPKPPA